MSKVKIISELQQLQLRYIKLNKYSLDNNLISYADYYHGCQTAVGLAIEIVLKGLNGIKVLNNG